MGTNDNPLESAEIHVSERDLLERLITLVRTAVFCSGSSEDKALVGT